MEAAAKKQFTEEHLHLFELVKGGLIPFEDATWMREAGGGALPTQIRTVRSILANSESGIRLERLAKTRLILGGRLYCGKAARILAVVKRPEDQLA
jgi:hypothetical protein